MTSILYKIYHENGYILDVKDISYYTSPDIINYILKSSEYKNMGELIRRNILRSLINKSTHFKLFQTIYNVPDKEYNNLLSFSCQLLDVNIFKYLATLSEEYIFLKEHCLKILEIEKIAPYDYKQPKERNNKIAEIIKFILS